TQYWNADAVFDVKCPQCSSSVEFFKDDTTRRCGQCGHRFVNPKMDFGCAAYCQYAEQCLGDLPPELAARQEDLLKDRVAVAVKRHLKTDFKRIGHITRRARHAEAIAKHSSANAKLPVVLIAAFLWDLDPVDGGEPEASVAASILSDLKAPAPLAEQVCKILALRNASQSDGADTAFKIVSDAEAQALAEERTGAVPTHEAPGP
ncbi:MAG: phosphohydrolase, partial [Desulfobacteraceae bacterium]